MVHGLGFLSKVYIRVPYLAEHFNWTIFEGVRLREPSRVSSGEVLFMECGILHAISKRPQQYRPKYVGPLGSI